LWYPTSNSESIHWVAAQGISTAFSLLLSGPEGVLAMLQRYQRVLADHVTDPDRLNGHVAQPNFGFSAHVHVAESDDLARRQAGPAFDWFMHTFTQRYVRSGHADRYHDRSNFDQQVERGRILVGSPVIVAQRLRATVEQTGANYFIGSFAFGSLPEEQVLSSVDLFAREVMPAVSGARAAPGSAR
jgi:alkanesulfonate monooxygenase SsuD/methylene tetrahydromethanopterin reductase-like flavin-dependent oxidoreductase (luciferase family)